MEELYIDNLAERRGEPSQPKASRASRPLRFFENLGKFLLPYEAVRIATDPEAMLLQFLQSTYRGAAETGEWNRGTLECAFGRPGVPSDCNARLERFTP